MCLHTFTHTLSIHNFSVGPQTRKGPLYKHPPQITKRCLQALGTVGGILTAEEIGNTENPKKIKNKAMAKGKETSIMN